MTEAEIRVLRPFLDDRGRLTQMPSKRQKQLLAVRYLAERIPAESFYSESGFNDLLDSLHTFHDPATLRRELYDGGYVDRAADGSGYHKRSNSEEGQTT